LFNGIALGKLEVVLLTGIFIVILCLILLVLRLELDLEISRVTQVFFTEKVFVSQSVTLNQYDYEYQ